MEIKKAKSIENMNIKCLIYGQSGSGKTVFLSSLSKVPKFNPMLIVDLEAGLTSASAMGIQDFDYVTLSNPQSGKPTSVVNPLMDDIGEIIKMGLSGKYKAIVIDSITELQNKVNDYVKSTSKIKDPFLMTLDDWGKSTNLMRYILRKLRDLPCHVFFSALINADKDDTTGAITYSPLLTPKLRESVQQYVDVVGLLVVRDNQRMIYTTSNDKFTAKDRFDCLGTGEATPNFFEKLDKSIQKEAK